LKKKLDPRGITFRPVCDHSEKVVEQGAALGEPTAAARRISAVRGIHCALAGVVLVSALAWGALALLSRTPWVFPDELIYSELARSIAAGHAPAIRDSTTSAYGLVYPLLIAPAWAISRNTETAYAIARVLGAVFMSLAAVPAFFLARRFTSERKALLVAVFTVLVPSMAYTGTLLTEVALYPLFLLAILGIVVALDVPSRRNQLLCLAGVALAFGTKAESVVLVAAYVVAILVFATLESRAGGHARAVLSQFMLTWWVLCSGACLAVVGGVVVSGDPATLLGKYSVAARNIDVLGTLRWFGGNLVALDLYVSVAPLAAFVIVAGRALSVRASRERRLFAAISVPIVVLVVATVAAFGSKPVAGAAGFSASTPLRERNFFVVAPLLLLALAMWSDDRDRRGPALPLACILAVVGVAAYPWGSGPTEGGPQNLSVVTWLIVAPNHVARIVVVSLWAVVCVALLRFCRWDRIGRLWIALAAAFVFAGVFSALVFANLSARTLRWGAGSDLRWIDRAVPVHTTVAVVWKEPGKGFANPLPRHRVVWVGEFFNLTLGPVYSLGARMPYDLPDTPVRVRDGIIVGQDGKPIRAAYVLALCRTGVSAPIVALNREVHAALYRTAGNPILVHGRIGACPSSPGY
jgi:Dolichyl-phosphate-mannose-protein mannosyltransferase